MSSTDIAVVEEANGGDLGADFVKPDDWATPPSSLQSKVRQSSLRLPDLPST
jgi:hypothetical protein